MRTYKTFHHLTTCFPAHFAVGPLDLLFPAWNILSLYIFIGLNVSPDYIHLNLLYFPSFQRPPPDNTFMIHVYICLVGLLN